MAGISKVTYGDEVLIDLTSDTVTPNDLLFGVSAHRSNGDQIVGALILGDLAYLNWVDYNTNQVINKPDLKALAFQDYIDYNSDQLINKPESWVIDYESDQIINKPPSAAEILRSIMEIYPDVPSGILFVLNADSEHAMTFSEGIFYHDGEGIVLDSNNSEGIMVERIPEDNGIRFTFPPLSFVRDVPDDGKIYGRRHGEWVELNI